MTGYKLTDANLTNFRRRAEAGQSFDSGDMLLVVASHESALARVAELKAQFDRAMALEASEVVAAARVLLERYSAAAEARLGAEIDALDARRAKVAAAPSVCKDGKNHGPWRTVGSSGVGIYKQCERCRHQEPLGDRPNEARIEPHDECDACRSTLYRESEVVYLCRAHYDRLASRTETAGPDAGQARRGRRALIAAYRMLEAGHLDDAKAWLRQEVNALCDAAGQSFRIETPLTGGEGT